MFNLINNELGKPTVGITACNIWENKDTLYAGYYVDHAELKDYSADVDNVDKKDKTKIELNNFGSQITTQHVTGNLVIVKQNLDYHVEQNNVKTKTILDNISRYELLNIIENIFVKDGIILDVNGNMKTYTYIVNPLEHLMLTDAQYEQHYVYHEYEVYTHIMMVIVDIREKNKECNEYATLLCGKPVCGTVFVALYRKPDYNENPPYIGLTIQRLKNILEIRSKSASFTTCVEKSDKEYINFDKILELEKNKHSCKKSLKVSEIIGDHLNMC
jgi:hypothetical protein